MHIEVKVQNGRITEANVLSGPSMPASPARSWIAENWKFKPEISGILTIPINYQLQAPQRAVCELAERSWLEHSRSC